MTRLCIVVEASLPPGEAANIAACIAAGLAGARPGLASQPLRDAAGFESLGSSSLPIAVLSTDGAGLAQQLQSLKQRPPDASCVVFPRYAQAMHSAAEYWERHATTDHMAEPMLGIGLAGPPAWVRRLTGALPLLR
nr:DUF2000 domain-containing protein [uncultured Caldimonas sp.]